jgi:ABC-2 type transport system permease protein
VIPPGLIPPGTSFATDVRTVLERELRPALRDPFTLAFSLLQPLVLLAFFLPLLDGMGFGASPLAWFVPGVLVMTSLFGTLGAGYALLMEAQTGAHERMLVTPLRRSSLIVGRALKELVPAVAQGLVIIAVTVPFGFRPHPVGALLGLAILGLLGIGVGALSYTLAVVAKGRDWVFWGLTQSLPFPLLILSGLLLPLDTAPGWMQVAARGTRCRTWSPPSGRCSPVPSRQGRSCPRSGRPWPRSGRPWPRSCSG